MSSTGAVMDAVGAVAVAAVTELLAENVTRGLRPLRDLPSDAFPHLFLSPSGGTPLESVELLSDLQERVTYTFAVGLVTDGDTQEETLSKLDAIRTALRSDRTLGGLVLSTYVSELGLLEHPDAGDRRVGDLVITAVAEPA